MVKFQKVPIAVKEESVYRCVIKLIWKRKVNKILLESKINITLFRRNLPANLFVFHALKAGELIVKSRPHF